MIDDEDLLAELHRLADGETAPKSATMEAEGAYAASTYRERFGSWTAACREAGLTPRQQGSKIPDAKLLEELERLADGDNPPTAAAMDEQGDYSAITYLNRFGSWGEACEAAGFLPRDPEESIPDEALIAELQRLADGDDPPTTTEMDEEGQFSTNTYWDRFDSWTEACRAAGLTPQRRTRPIPEDELLEELRRLADGKTGPTTSDMAESRFSPKPYYSRYGSWAEACRAAGLTPPNPPDDETDTT